MLSFKKLTLADIPALRPYFSLAHSRACDNSVGGTFMWRDYFSTEYAIIDGALVFKGRYLSGETIFSMPLGGSLTACVQELDDWCRAHKLPLIFCLVTRGDADELTPLFPARVVPQPNWSDYLYRTQDLQELAGRKYGGQRNHIHFFERTFSDWRYEPLTEKNLADAVEFYRHSPLIDSKDSPLFREEQNKVFEVLAHFDEYAMDGGILYAGGKVVAFCLGEVVGDTVQVHIEKADAECRGAYQMIVNQYARHQPAGILYMNREDDAGDEGLRTSKLSYHPCEILEKFMVVGEPSA